MTKTLSTSRTWSGKTGWCMDGHHSWCPVVTLGGRECACDCHGTKPSAGSAA